MNNNIFRRVREVETGVKEIEERKSGPFNIATIIGVIIAIAVGVSLMPMIMDEVNKTKEAIPEGSESIITLLDYLPVMFGLVIAIGVVSWIFVGRGESRDVNEEMSELSSEDAIRQMQGKKMSHLVYKG